MTPKQQRQFNAMRETLQKIAKWYATPKGLRKAAQVTYGLPYEEVLEMAYENIQADAAQAVKGVKAIKTDSDLSDLPF